MSDLDWTRSEKVDDYCSCASISEECSVHETLTLAIFDVRIRAEGISSQDALLLAQDILAASEKYLGKRWWFD